MLDSVDRRFPSINKYLGREYLKNFILNSPILHIKPGMPRYTGGNDSLISSLTETYGLYSRGASILDSIGQAIGRKWLFAPGQKLQKRLFSVRPEYLNYIDYVDYLCRSAAMFLNLTTGSEITDLPKGIS